MTSPAHDKIEEAMALANEGKQHGSSGPIMDRITAALQKAKEGPPTKG